MSALRFSIPGEPRGKGRPRFGKSRAGFVTVRTDDKTAAYENLVALAARQAGAQPIEGPLDIYLCAFFTVPQSWSKRRRLDALTGREGPGKFDLDNILKAVLDGLNGIAFHDDKQIVTIQAAKRFSDVARCEVSVFPARGSTEQAVASDDIRPSGYE